MKGINTQLWEPDCWRGPPSSPPDCSGLWVLYKTIQGLQWNIEKEKTKGNKTVRRFACCHKAAALLIAELTGVQDIKTPAEE